MSDDVMQVRAVVSGHVQGVGFRWWTTGQAQELGLVGRAVNLPNGDVEVVAQGPREDVAALLERLQPNATGQGRPGSVTEVTSADQKSDPSLRSFTQG